MGNILNCQLSIIYEITNSCGVFKITLYPCMMCYVKQPIMQHAHSSIVIDDTPHWVGYIKKSCIFEYIVYDI